MKKPFIFRHSGTAGVGLILCAALLTVHCAHKETPRNPSSLQNIFTDRETQALGQILGEDSPTEKFRRKMKIEFHTNGDRKYLSETSIKSIQNALAATLGEENPSQGLAKLALGNVKNEVMDNFIKTLKVYKLVNLGLQFDLNFAPAPYQGSFAPELSSNQLVRLDETGTLSKKWEQIESQGFVNQLYANSVLVREQEAADYIGGAVSIFIEILDTKPKLGLPKLAKNGVKGFIRYRRYFRVNTAMTPGTCNGFSSNIILGSRVPVFYTVDVYKNFNLKDIIPTEETLEIYPGLIASTQEGRTELLPETGGRYVSMPTMRYQVGLKKVVSQSEFVVKKLVYDLKDRKFDVMRSQIEMTSFRSMAKNQRSSEEAEAKEAARREYFDKCQGVLEKQLLLNQVIPGGVL